jgi:hypothetical protein
MCNLQSFEFVLRFGGGRGPSTQHSTKADAIRRLERDVLVGLQAAL